RYAEPVIDLLETVDVDDEDRRLYPVLGLGDRNDRLQPVHEELAVGQAGQVVVNGVMQQPLLGLLLFGHLHHRADTADDLAVRPDDRARAQREPVIMAIGSAQAEALCYLAAPMFQDHVKRRAECIAIVRMKRWQPGTGRAAEAVRG